MGAVGLTARGYRPRPIRGRAHRRHTAGRILRNSLTPMSPRNKPDGARGIQSPGRSPRIERPARRAGSPTVQWPDHAPAAASVAARIGSSGGDEALHGGERAATASPAGWRPRSEPRSTPFRARRRRAAPAPMDRRARCARRHPGTPRAPRRARRPASRPSSSRGRAGRVVEAAQHAGHVAQRGSGQAALGQRTRRLTLEVDDREAAVRRARAAGRGGSRRGCGWTVAVPVDRPKLSASRARTAGAAATSRWWALAARAATAPASWRSAEARHSAVSATLAARTGNCGWSGREARAACRSAVRAPIVATSSRRIAVGGEGREQRRPSVPGRRDEGLEHGHGRVAGRISQDSGAVREPACRRSPHRRGRRSPRGRGCHPARGAGTA